jgi:UDPglucose 6-dehydrogenase
MMAEIVVPPKRRTKYAILFTNNGDQMSISVIGLGKLGAVLAGVMAEKGHEVVGVDVNPASVAAINRGASPVREPGLDEMIHRNAARMSATTNVAEAIARTDITFVVVPTPSGPDGTFSLQYVMNAVEPIAQGLREKSGYHVVVISSTVMPGSTGGEVLPLLERISGKKCGPDFGLCYNPEFIALGSVIRDMSAPDMILIGESDERAGATLEALYRTVCVNEPPVARMNFVNAELTKISVNTYVTTKISYANMLAEVCEKVPGADCGVISQAIGLDTRIGRKYLKGAFGYGGPCFPRDNTAFAKFADMNGVDAALAKTTDQVNRRQVTRLAERVRELLPADGTVGILGLSYKPDTEVIEESQGLMLARQLAREGVPVCVYDPAAMKNAQGVLGAEVTYSESMEACAAQASVLVIATPWKQFEAIRPEHLAKSSGRPVLIDWWGILKQTEFEQVAEYVTCGRGPGIAGTKTAREAAASIASRA